jgi:tetratricopeptide (TPR) repeat protein
MDHARIELLEKFIREDPSDPFNYYALALEYLKTNPSKAKLLFEDLLVNHADYLPVYYTAGTFYADGGDEHRAREILSKGVEVARRQSDVKALRELQGALLNLES